MQIRFLAELTACTVAVSFPLLSYAQAQMNGQKGQAASDKVAPSLAQATSTRTNFEGRGVVQGSTFTRGRNANVSLTLNGGNFILNLAEPPGNRARVQYRGSVVRQPNSSANSNSFTLDGRVQTFESSASTRILNNTTGTCRIEVFDVRVISSSCRAAAPDSTTQFLGLEQF